MSQDPQKSTQAPSSQAAAPSVPAPAPPALAPQAAVAESAPESPLWTGRTHWTHFIGSVMLWVLGAVLIVVVGRILASKQTVSSHTAYWVGGVLLGASTLLVWARILWNVLSSRYRLTTQRLFIERGILSQTIDQTELLRLDDVRVHKTLVDRILGLGAVEIISTDASDRAVRLEGIKNPEAIAEHLRERMRQLRRKSLYVENL